MKLGDEVEKIGGDYTFVGVIVADFKKLGGQRRFVVEDDRGVLHVYSEKNLQPLNQKSGFALRCYKEVYGMAGTFLEARLFQENHIRTCSQGPMPWAVDVSWAAVPGIGWAAAAHGEWLNHAILRYRASDPLSAAAVQFLLENEADEAPAPDTA
jgi:hypothetical protein